MVRAPITKVPCFQGAKGGTYYKNANGKRIHLSTTARKQAKCNPSGGAPHMWGSATNIRLKGLKRPGRMDAAIARGRARACYTGNKGGIYYLSAKSGKRVYTKDRTKCGRMI